MNDLWRSATLQDMGVAPGPAHRDAILTAAATWEQTGAQDLAGRRNARNYGSSWSDSPKWGKSSGLPNAVMSATCACALTGNSRQRFPGANATARRKIATAPRPRYQVACGGIAIVASWAS